MSSATPNNVTAKTGSVRKQKSPLPLIAASFLIVISLAAGFILLNRRISEIEYRQVGIGSEIFRLEIADNEATRRKGLSGRQSLGKNEGMLFDFKSDGDWRIWMPGMHFDIDIAWLDVNGKIVSIKEQAEPGSYPEVYHAGVPNRYVIELPAGSYERLGVKQDDYIRVGN